MLASLDPLGLPLATFVIDGNEADDPLYKPAIEQVRRYRYQQGVLYVGDCKMAASSTRASIEYASDYYLMPLPALIASVEVLDAYLTPVGSPSPTIEPIYHTHYNGFVSEIAQGFEINLMVRSFKTKNLRIEKERNKLSINFRRKVKQF